MYKVMFATPPLMLMPYQGSDLEEIIQYVQTGIEYGAPTNGAQSNTPSDSGYILEDTVFENLKSFIQNCVDNYTREILLSNQKLKITQSWVNKTETGTIHTMHYHPNSVLSGVFYFNNHSSPIEFISDRKDQFSLSKDVEEYNEFVSSSYSVPSQKGVLIIFPSYILHRVSVNQEEETRYSLSFNTFPSTEMGSQINMSYVNF